MDVCPLSPQFVCWNLPLNVVLGGRAFGRRLGHGQGGFMNEISAHRKEAPKNNFTPFHYERTWQKVAVYKPGSGLTDTEI